MSVFTSQLNAVTGRMEWNEQSDDYDYQQEVARSSYADMLHDNERNRKYYEGIRAAIDHMRNANREVHVLDIGTGTGLLSMMAARLGADTVHACEEFKPMASCAQRIIEQNGFENRIKVIAKRSTDLVVGSDLPRRCNLLVTEVFDTELIGEDALSTFKHAHEKLLEENSLVVPSSAVLYAQVIDSELVRRWNKLDAFPCRIKTPDYVTECHGSAAVHDVQLSQLDCNDDFTQLTEPIPVFGFDWTGSSVSITFDRSSVAQGEALNDGTTHAIFMWWDITMDPAGEVLLSCAPYWSHPDTVGCPVPSSDMIPWRDHWMQAIYYPPREIAVKKSQKFTLISSHDKCSLWFTVNSNSEEQHPSEVKDLAPICLCGLHVNLSRTRVGALSDKSRHRAYVSALRDVITPESTVLVVSDSCLYALVAATLGAHRVYIAESNQIIRRALEMYIRDNDLEDRVVFVDANNILETVKEPLNVYFSEPFFYSSYLPWHALYAWFKKVELNKIINGETKIIPRRAELRCMAVELRDLWKIRSPVGIVEGFNLSAFDELIEPACQIADTAVEPHALWEYPARALTHPQTIAEFVMTVNPSEQNHQNTVDIVADGNCNAVIVWMDYVLNERETYRVTTGPISQTIPGQRVKWDMYSKQGVYLLRTGQSVCSSNKLHYECKFSDKTGEVTLNFDIK